MKKILTNRQFFLIALSVLVISVIVFWMNSKYKPENALNYQVDFVLTQNDNRYLVDHSGAKNDQHLYDRNTVSQKIVNDKKTENDKKVEVHKKIDKSDFDLPIENLPRYVSSFSSELLLAIDLQEKFDADEMDNELATAAEKNLAYVFYQGMDWQEFSPQEISCKTNICRVKLIVVNDEKNNKLMDLISNQMKEQKIQYSYALPVKLPVEEVSYLYFIKNSTPGVSP